MFDKFLCKHIHQKKITLCDVVGLCLTYFVKGVICIILGWFFLVGFGTATVAVLGYIGLVPQSTVDILNHPFVFNESLHICVYGIPLFVVSSVLYSLRNVQVAECPLNKK